MPWNAGVRERVVSRGTAPTHTRWFWVGLWAAAAVAGSAAAVPVLFERGPAIPGYDVITRLSGVSFAAWGLIAWRRRPDSAVGRMLTLTGFGVFVYPVLIQVDSPATFTAANLFGDLWIVVFIALYLTFVTGGRLASTVDFVLVAVVFVGIFVAQFAVLLFLPDPGNLLRVWPDAGIASALDKLRMAVLICGSIAVAFVIGRRWRVAS